MARAARGAAVLGPGLHVARVEMAAAGGAVATYRVRLRDARSVIAVAAAGVSPSLIDACMRDGRPVVVADGDAGVEIAGALQTAPAPIEDARGTLVLDARHVRLRATESLELEVPGSSLRLEPGGAVRIEGDRMTIDVAAILQILSARVEVP